MIHTYKSIRTCTIQNNKSTHIVTLISVLPGILQYPYAMDFTLMCSNGWDKANVIDVATDSTQDTPHN